MAPTFKTIKKIQYVIKDNFRTPESFFLIFLIATVLLSFVLYIVIFASPSGTDVYTHMYNTQNMFNSKSLSDFYEKSLNLEYLGYDYPFGLWYFGSLTMKITGLDVYQIAYIIPLILIFILLGMYYCYARELTDSSVKSLLSLIFLISMTQLALNLLNYSTSTFVMPFLVTIFFLAMRDMGWKNIVLLSVIIFALCFSHTGTFLFLTLFAVAYFLLRAAIWAKFDVNFFIIVVSLLFCFVIAISLFPFVQQQYINKGTLIVDTASTVSKWTFIPFFKDAGQIFYDSIFVNNNYVFAFLWSALLFGTGEFLVFISSRLKKRFFGERNHFIIPFIGTFGSMPKGILMTPFWVGPLHSLLSVFGIFKLDDRGKCIALSLVFSALIPGSLTGSSGTGSIRETFYLFLIIPVTSALGFYYLTPVLSRLTRSKLKRALAVLIYCIIFITLIAVPVIGCLYYQPPITMTKEENINLGWLASVGNQMEGVAADAYRDRMTMYANKTVPSISAGTETKEFSKNLYYTYFSNKAEKYTKALADFQVQYLITSDRTFKGYGLPRSSLAIDSNTEIDKIYDSGDFFSFYKIISRPEIQKTDIGESLTWNSNQPGAVIQETGSVFKFENSEYKVKLSDRSPAIQYIGSPTRNSLGEGGYSDLLDISWTASDTKYAESYSLEGLTYSDIQRSDNEIVYKTKLFSPETRDTIASLSVKYIFNDLAVKREITLTNDLEKPNRTVTLDINAYSSIFAPMTDFEYHQTNPDETKWVKKIRYPSQGSITLNDRIVDSIIYNYGTTGLYVLYDDSAPYPNKIWYSGSTQYDYGEVNVQSDHLLRPGESVNIVQYFSVNNKATAIKNAETYTSVSPSPFENGQLPLVITGLASGSNLTETEKTALTMLSQGNIPYTVVLRTKTTSSINLPGIVPAEYFSRCYNQTLCKNISVQSNQLALLKQNTNISGIRPSQYGYDFNTLKSLSVNNYTYMEFLSVPAPFDVYYREGIRNPQFAYIDGENTGVVLIPVTELESDVLSKRSEPDPIFSMWNDTINSVRVYGGVAAFHWDPSDIGNPELSELFESFLRNATANGVTVTTPEAIATHMRQLEAVQVNVTRSEVQVILHARNIGEEPVSGITYEVIMPAFENTCPYNVTNGTIARSDIEDGNCRLYASFSLDGFESKEIRVNYADTMKQMFTKIPELFQGKDTIKVTDENNQPVKSASVRIGSKYYESNTKGEVTFSTDFGWQTITIEKAGYNPVTITTYVKPLIYKYTKFMNNMTG
jgi:hypothetical protein